MNKIVSGVSLFLFSGCTALNPSDRFDLVRGVVEERTGHRVVWNQGTPEDKEVALRIEKTLQGNLLLADAVEISLLNNPTLQAEYEELGIAQAQLVQAGLLKNPVLSLERRFRGKAAEVDIAQDFLSLFLIPLRTKAADAELQAVTEHVTQTILNHTTETKAAFYSLQGEQQTLEMRESIVRALEASYQASQELRKAGNTSVLEVQNEANMLNQAKVELSEAGVRVLEERERLNVLLGAWGGNTNWKIEKRLPDLPVSEVALAGLESYAIKNRRDLVAAKKELESIAVQVGLRRYEALIPEITVSGHFEKEPEGNSTSGPSIAFTLPLFNWGEAASAEGNALFRQHLRRFEALAIDIRSKVRVAYGRMKAARARALYFYTEVLPVQKKILEQTQLFYNGMFLGVFQLLQAKQAQITAGQTYVETLKEYWLRRTELEQAVGGSFKGLTTTDEKAVSANVPTVEINHSTGAEHHHHGGRQ